MEVTYCITEIGLDIASELIGSTEKKGFTSVVKVYGQANTDNLQCNKNNEVQIVQDESYKISHMLTRFIHDKLMKKGDTT